MGRSAGRAKESQGEQGENRKRRSISNCGTYQIDGLWCRRLEIHCTYQHPGGRIEGLQKGRGRNDARSLGHHNGYARLHERFAEIDNRLALGVDHERCEDHVGLAVNQVGNQTIPFTILKCTPFTIFDPHQLVGETELLGKFLEQIDAEAAAALIEGLVAVCLAHINVGSHLVVGRHTAEHTAVHQAFATHWIGGRQIDIGCLLEECDL